VRRYHPLAGLKTSLLRVAWFLWGQPVLTISRVTLISIRKLTNKLLFVTDAVEDKIPLCQLSSTKHRLSGRRSPDCLRGNHLRPLGSRTPDSHCFVEAN